MSTRDLIDAIESGNLSAIQQHFQDAIMSRVAERLDTMRIETAKNMFKASVNESADFIHQVLADNDINSKVMGNTVHVDHDDVEKAQELVKYHGYDHKVIGGLNEVLKKSDPASKWIKDFVDSDDPKFKGKTKAERTKMALGAYYGAQRNESAELDETSCGTKKKWGAIKNSMGGSTKK